MESILLICGVAVAFLLNIAVLKKRDIIENIVLAVVSYFSCYIVVSGLLFWGDAFRIILAEGIVLGMELFVLLLSLKNISLKNMQWNIERNIIPLAICIVMLPFIWGKFEIYGMGQDEGVYQTQAIAFMEGNTNLQHEIESYHKVSTEKREEYLRIIQRKLVGFYLYDESLPTMDAENKIGDTSGFYHGVPTFSAILALWGKIAGMKNMADIQTILYFCSVFLIYYVAGNLGLGKLYQCIGTIIYAASPMVIWVSKATLTEMMLVCLMDMFLYYLSEKDNKCFILASPIPIIAFSFFHITIYTVIPAIALLYFILYFYGRKEEYLIANIIVLIAFAAGIHMMVRVAATYSFVYNFMPLYQLIGFINEENILAILISGSVAGVLVNIILYIIMKKGALTVNWDKAISYKASKISIRIVVTAALGLNIVVLLRMASESGVIDALRFSTLIGYGLFAGFILLICAIFGMIIYAGDAVKEKNNMLIYFMFFYLVLVYAAVLRPRINYYYYYGRYLVPYVPCVILTGILTIRKIKKKAIQLVCVTGTVLIAALTIIVYDVPLINQKDDTRLSWQILTDCTHIFGEDDIVIVEQDIAPVLYLPLVYLTDAEIYLEYDLDEQRDDFLYDSSEKEIFFVSDEFYGKSGWESIYTGVFTKSEDENRTEALVPLPTEMKAERQHINIYKYYPDQYEYKMGEAALLTNGFYDIEGGSRWTDGQGTVYCYLRPAEYEICVRQGSFIPMEELGKNSELIRLYLNGELADEYIMTQENKQDDIVFHVGREWIRQGRNELMIESEEWYPKDLGRDDVRQLGISIESITFYEERREQ